MKVLLGVDSSINRFLPIAKSLEQFDHEVRTFITDDFARQISHIGNILDRFSFHFRREVFHEKRILKFERLIKDFKPDIIFFINFPMDIFSVEEFERLSIGRRFRIFFVDPLKNHPDVEEYLRFCDQVFSYDQDDAERFNVQYLPLGYSPSYEMQFDPQISKTIDVSFVGSLFKNRLEFLEPLAKFMKDHGKTLKVFSPAFKRKNFWKRPIFNKKFPNLAKCIENGFVDPKDAARIYSQSKICLNIHVPDASSPNPRTFEILATGSFQLIDERKYYSNLIPSKDLATFKSIEELINRVEYFLNHEEERIEIARNGYKKVVPEFRLANCLERILK